MNTEILPLPIRIANQLGRFGRKLGLPIGRLDPERMIAAARKSTGLRDFASENFRDPLDRLIRSLEQDASLHALGRVIARADITRYLATRLQLEDWHRRHPEIAKCEIRRPIFIVGQGRTGTTILHELLALDPNNRVPQTWEIDAPFPPPARASYESDPRIAACQKELDRAESLIPAFAKMHRMGATLPQECVRITGMDFLSLIFAAQWRVTGYTRWLINDADLGEAYANHRRMLQLLQWRCPAERWVLKSPGHQWHLEALLREYPDARFVQTHRDPLKVLSSITSLETVLRSMSSDAADPHEIAREWSEWNCEAYDRSVKFRESGAVAPSRVVDLHFRQFVADPLCEIRGIYDRFEIDLQPQSELLMKQYLERNPDDRDGKHVHRFAATGLDIDEERAKVRRYQETFDVESESNL